MSQIDESFRNSNKRLLQNWYNHFVVSLFKVLNLIYTKQIQLTNKYNVNYAKLNKIIFSEKNIETNVLNISNTCN